MSLTMPIPKLYKILSSEISYGDRRNQMYRDLAGNRLVYLTTEQSVIQISALEKEQKH